MHPNSQYDKKTIMLILVILAQALVVTLNGHWGFFALEEKVNISSRFVALFSLIAGVILAIAALYLIQEILRLAKKEKEAELHLAHLNESKELVDVLRTNRHDYLNHLQVIMGSIQLNKPENALRYINDVLGGFETESRVSNLKHPEVAALLIKTLNSADKNEIDLSVDMESDLNGLRIPSYDLSRIISNLLRNAFYAVKDLPSEEREVEIALKENTNQFIISVKNMRPVIPSEQQTKVFEKGFTTKGIDGSGLGLAIVKELVETNGGSVQLVSTEETGTVFKVIFPKG